VAGSALNAQSVRMNLTASNLANAGTVSGSEQDAFRGKRAIFKAILEQQGPGQVVDYQGGVSVTQIKDDPTPVRRVMDPGNPVADKDGYVYTSNVNEMGEMVDMMAASRSYQNNVEVINTARQLMMRTLEITKA
jgi:flagellar basal-body rod protein FlgC